MQPRLSTSRKWTPLPEELISQISSVFRQNFKDQIGQAEVEVQGRIFPEEILIQLGFRPQKALKQSGFLISIAYKRERDNVMKLIHLSMDVAAALFEQLFAAENDHDFPRTWQEVEFEGRSVYVQYTTVNTKLEAEADRLLGEHAQEGLAQGEWDEDEEVDVEQIKAKLGLNEDE